MVHLVYCDNVGKKGQRILDKIMNNTKTMVVRGAAGRKLPHSRVFAGDILYFMQKGTTSICALAKVDNVQNFAKLTDDEIVKVLADNQPKLNLTDKQKERWHKKCLCLVEFSDVKVIEPPFVFEHQNTMDDWLIIEKIEDVLVGTSMFITTKSQDFN